MYISEMTFKVLCFGLMTTLNRKFEKYLGVQEEAKSMTRISGSYVT